MDFDSLKAVNSGLGTAGVIVMDKTTDLIRQLLDYQGSITMKVVANVRPVEREQVGYLK